MISKNIFAKKVQKVENREKAILMDLELQAEAIILIDLCCIKEITSRSSNPTQPKVLGLLQLGVLGPSKWPKMQNWGVVGLKIGLFHFSKSIRKISTRKKSV